MWAYFVSGIFVGIMALSAAIYALARAGQKVVSGTDGSRSGSDVAVDGHDDESSQFLDQDDYDDDDISDEILMRIFAEHVEVVANNIARSVQNMYDDGFIGSATFMVGPHTVEITCGGKWKS